jgi:pimeloyl-ACP methyl ester carboxylesterase
MHRETPDHWPAIRPKPGQPDTGFTAVPSNFDEESKSVQNTFPPIESAFVAVERACMHYLHAGTGPPMLLIHGLVGSSANWRGNIAALAQAASVYAIDQLNMGRSQRIPGLDAGLEATADRIAAAMEALGLTQVDIVGHSHGGAVALMFAARHPERVRRLILFAPANPWSYPANRLVRVFSTPLGRLVARIGPYLPARLQQIGLDRMYGDPARIPAGCLKNYVHDLRIPGTMPHILEIVRNWFAEMAKLEAVLPRVAGIPTLLLWGDRDGAVDPASAAPLQRVLQRSELHTLPGGGHILFEEFPQQTDRLLLEWLRCGTLSSPPTQVAAPGRPHGMRPASIPAEQL